VSSSDRAAELRAQADALDTLASLEADLIAAKQAYADEPTPENREAKQAAAVALREARSLTRTNGVSVGGDAYVDEEV
ncbi:hypothetical protein JYK22_21515, partial [Nonomuraea sp. RK-328]|nr:hypothetical protein [Nonomuraea sp. RK-328]